jgi:acyl-CoA thioesterase-2
MAVMPTARSDLDAVVASLDLEELDLNLYRGTSPDWEVGRLFGGQVASQALAAAYRTVEHIHVHSLHSYFLRPGDATIPVIYDVDRIRDGRSFSTRRVVARQRGEAIFNLAASFHIDEPGFDHQQSMPDVGGPDDFPTPEDHGHTSADYMPPHWDGPVVPIRVRSHVPPSGELPDGQISADIWVRANGTLPDDEVLHRCVLTYMSDLALLGTSIRAHAKGFDTIMAASLDHALWFHREVRADQWLLYSLHSPSASGARGFNIGHYFTEDGVLLASAAQEGLIRRFDPSLA